MESRTSPVERKKRVLIVDDEPDVLETIEETLEMFQIDKAGDYESAVERMSERKYDLAILDVMGVNGLDLLRLAVKRGIPAVMLTAHAMNVQTFIASVEKGAIAFLPKEKMPDLPDLLLRVLDALESGKEPWRILFGELAGYFDRKFGPDWKEDNKEFWDDFSRVIETRFSSDVS